MKQSLIFLPVFLIGTTLLGFPEESNSFSTSGNHPILILQDPTEIPDAPRMPAFNPFIAELMEGNNAILLGVTSYCGTVTVHIISTAGDDIFTYFGTADGAIILPISGNTGYYSLTITTASGTHFIGDFTI